MAEIRNAILPFTIATGAAIFPTTAIAGENAAALNMAAQVRDSCTISSEDLRFDVLDTQSTTQKDASATITVTCTTFKVFQVRIGAGFHNTAGQRRLSNGSNFINYQVYQDNARITPWGNTVLTERWAVAAAPSFSQDLEAYGRASGFSPTTAPGTYTDQLDIIVNF